MLSTKKPRHLIHHFSYGDQCTKVTLQNRKNGEMVYLSIFSRIPLSLRETRDSITAAMGESHWNWRQIDWSSEYIPF
jgi:hypothetical protein